MKLKSKLLAIIWDFDGTIADSRQKNFSVTKKLMNDIVNQDLQNFHVLNSLSNYHSAHTKATNWREFYRESFGLSEEQIDEAGRLWTEYQLNDHTPVPLIDGVASAIRKLSKYPQGIVSQNSKENIIRYLKEKDILKYFRTVVGYEEVLLTKQKPLPDGLLFCLDKLVVSDTGYVMYIGDHETDVRCTMNANDVLANKKVNIEIISIGAFYGFDVDTSKWNILPDFEVKDAGKIPEIINRVRNSKKLN